MTEPEPPFLIIKNLTVTGNITGDSFIGAILGKFYGTLTLEIRNCHSNIDIIGNSSIGGIVGSITKFEIPPMP